MGSSSRSRRTGRTSGLMALSSARPPPLPSCAPSVRKRLGVDRAVVRSVEVRLDDLEDGLRHAAVGEIGGPAEVRRQHQVIETSRPAPASARSESTFASAASSTMAPQAVLTKMPRGPMRRRRASSSRPRLSSDSFRWTETNVGGGQVVMRRRERSTGRLRDDLRPSFRPREGRQQPGRRELLNLVRGLSDTQRIPRCIIKSPPPARTPGP
jgi:hypothetical protein